MVTVSSLSSIGVGIDTARYGHRVAFLRSDRQPAAPSMTVMENREGYDALRQRLEQLQQQYPGVPFYVRIDAAGQYAANLEHFLRSLPLALTISVGEPKRNKDYRMAHFPKRTCDDTESRAMARFAVVELPSASSPTPPQLAVLREIAGRLQVQAKEATRSINRLHNLLARAFPELACLTQNLAAGWVLRLLNKYPSADKIAQARLTALEKIPYLPSGMAQKLQQAAQRSVASLQGPVSASLVKQQVAEVCHQRRTQKTLRQLLVDAYAALPAGNHCHLTSIPGIGALTAAALVAKAISIDRFQTPNQLVGYFGIFPEENTSGVDKEGRPLPAGTMVMSRKGNDLVRGLLWMAAKSAMRHNPAVRALYRRLKANHTRGDVALGHCMRKLLQLVFAIWKTGQPFQADHYAWENPPQRPAPTNNNAVGHKREEIPAQQVVTTADSSVEPDPSAVNPVVPVSTAGPGACDQPAAQNPHIDFRWLRQQVTMQQVLGYLGLLDQFKGSGPQLRGRCPLHAPAHSRNRTFSVHLQKNIFQCFDSRCGAKGNVLDFWAAYHRLPPYEAACHLAATFALHLNREEEPVA